MSGSEFFLMVLWISPNRYAVAIRTYDAEADAGMTDWRFMECKTKAEAERQRIFLVNFLAGRTTRCASAK